MYYGNDWISKLERKFRKYAIPNLPKIIVSAMVFVYISNMFPDFALSPHIYFVRALIFRGEIWRIISFIFLPPAAGIIFIFFALYFFWMMASSLENEWGTFKFNLFYFCGVLGTIIGGFIMGYATNHYLYLSLLFAFAFMFPNFEIRLFFILPLKIKYLAYANAVLMGFMFISENAAGRVSLLISLINVAIFFGGNAKGMLQRHMRRAKWKRNFKMHK